MEVPQSSSSADINGQSSAAPAAVTLLPPVNFGTLGPALDSADSGGKGPQVLRAQVSRLAPFMAVASGVLAAVLVATIGSAHVPWRPLKGVGTSRSQLDALKPQKQAESLLEQAISHSDGAVDQISSRVDGWEGKLNWNPQIATLTTAALNSDDRRVRQSGVEVELAAYGLSKNSASLDYVLKTASSPDHAQKIWALWALGLMGNQGVGTAQAVDALTSHLKDPDEESRRWAVEGLALVGSDETIAPLLKTMHDDPSAAVRERAACSLAQSGMFTQEQRLSMVPQLLNYTDDPALDAQTHAWAFQALGDITRQRLPSDSSAWRNWYENQVASAQ